MPNNGLDTILIVEDDLSQRQLLRRFLERSGYWVEESMGAHHALRDAETVAPDLILLDIRLSDDIDGWTILQGLKASAATKAISVILVSAYMDIDDLLRARAAGADDCIAKPVSLDEMLMRIKRTLASREDDVSFDEIDL